MRLSQRLNHLASGGYAILGLLIVIALGMLIYYFAIWRIESAALKKQEQSPDDYPWVEDWRIRDSAGPAPRGQVSTSAQADIVETVQLTGAVTQDGRQRGRLELLLYPDGIVEGSWTGEYNTETAANCQVMMGDVAGNTDPTKVYQDERGEDASQLFIITSGRFLILQDDKKTNRTQKLIGHIYITGWVARDFWAFGTLHLTSDKVNQQVLEWAARPAPPEGLGYH